MTRPRRSRPAVGALVALLLALPACGGDDDTSSQAGGSTGSTPGASAGPTTSPPGTPDATSTPSPPSGETVARAVYYLRDVQPAGPRLYREFHARPAGADALRDAVETMLSAPPRDPDYTSLWPAGVEVLDARIEGDLATVDLSAKAAEGQAGSSFEAASLQQLVHTVTAAEPTVRRVQLLVDGERRETLWGHVGIGEPLTRAPQEATLGPVWITTPEEGGSLRAGSEFGGSATVFEATVSWHWVRDDVVVAEGFSTATEGAPGRGEWSARVDVPPGQYELRAFETSAEDGDPMFVETKRVTVTG